MEVFIIFTKNKFKKNVAIFNIDKPLENILFFAFLHAEHHVFATYSKEETKEKILEKISNFPLKNDNFTLFHTENNSDLEFFFGSIRNENKKLDILIHNPDLYNFGNFNTLKYSNHNISFKEELDFILLLNTTDPTVFSSSCKIVSLYNNQLVKLMGFTLNEPYHHHISSLLKKHITNHKFDVIFFNHPYIHSNFWSNLVSSLPHEQENNQSPSDLDIFYFYNSYPLSVKANYKIINRILDISESERLLKTNFSSIPLKNRLFFLSTRLNFQYGYSFSKLKKRFSFKKNKKNKVI